MDDLRKVQLCQLDMLLEVKRICNEYGIKYFLAGGTLIGAVRHKGFIPWDDDLDIGFERSEYKKFIDVCKNEGVLKDDFFLQTWDTDSGYGFGFAKLRINGTRYVEHISQKVKSHDGIYIDLFPLDDLPNPSLANKQIKKFYFWSRMLMYKKGYISWSNSLSRKILALVIKTLGLFYSDQCLKKKIELITSPEKRANILINYFGVYKERDVLSREDIGSYTELEFEGETFLAPQNYHSYLTKIYGDYMRLPPEEQRTNRHRIEILDFGKYSPSHSI